MNTIRIRANDALFPGVASGFPAEIAGFRKNRLGDASLPDRLRTLHCFNDLHHAMLVILFRHGLSAIQAGNRRLATYYLDNATLYLLVHFLAEEEGVLHAVREGWTDEGRAAAHAAIHLDLLDRWRGEIFAPFKTETLGLRALLGPTDEFYRAVLDHIAEEDQGIYGVASGETEEHVRSQLVHVAGTGLPLSPFMEGVEELAEALAPEAAALVAEESWAPRARQCLRSLCLDKSAGLGAGVRGQALRDRAARLAV